MSTGVVGLVLNGCGLFSLRVELSLLNFCCFTGVEDKNFGICGGFHFFFVGLYVLPDGGPGVIVNRDDVFCLEKFCGDGCIFWTHGEVVADGENSIVEGVKSLKKLHVAEDGGVTGKVELGAVKINDESTGMSSGDAAAVKGRGDPDFAKGELAGSA